MASPVQLKERYPERGLVAELGGNVLGGDQIESILDTLQIKCVGTRNRPTRSITASRSEASRVQEWGGRESLHSARRRAYNHFSSILSSRTNMPLIFIHGVNVRQADEGFDRDVAVRDELLQRLLLKPLTEVHDRFRNLKIISPYWGDDGVSFRWNQATLPQVDVIEHLGAVTETPGSDLDFTTAVNALSRRPASPNLEPLGPAESLYKQAALADLSRFIEAILSPIILSEMDLPDRRADIEALLLIAGRETARQESVKTLVLNVKSDKEVIEVLKQAILSEFKRQLELSKLSPAPGEGIPAGDLEPQGTVSDFFTGTFEKIGEVFDRTMNAPARATTVATLAGFRGSLHKNLTRFLGDVFVYLNERGDAGHAGPIVAAVLAAFSSARVGEPLIVITHSMGGNILYDVLTHYKPDVTLDAWISVASQVGQFEEMKLFRASDKAVGSPAKVKGLRDRVKYWLNIYDPADVLAFKTAPIFADADDDIEFLTGASAFKAHGAYFKRPSFYDLVAEHLLGRLV